MLQALYNAASGLRAEQTNIDTIGNNVANVNTVGFQASRTEFADALYTQINKPLQSGAYLQQGSGMVVSATQKSLAAGAPVSSGLSTDFMLQGEGYFTVLGPQGPSYTRDGSFGVSMENGAAYLVTKDGHYVLDTNNQRIRIPGDATLITADSAGGLYLNQAKFATLKVVTFPNPEGLADAGANLKTATPASGAASAAAQPDVSQGWLESSNVDLVSEMTRLMMAQRAYSVLGTAVRTADDMESMANSMSK